jgi:hypothetical protein
MDQYLAVRKFYGAINGQSIIAGGYTYATSFFRGYAPLLSSNTYAWHLLNSQIRKTVPSSKLDTAKVRQRRPSTKAPVPSLRKQLQETSVLMLS